MPEQKKKEKKKKAKGKKNVTKSAKTKELNLSQLKFVIEYVKNGGNTKQAAEVAKISPSQAYRLVKQDHIKDEIAFHKKQMVNEAVITQNWVLLQQKELYEKCVQPTPVLDKEGNETGLLIIEQPAVARGLLRDMGDFLGMYNHNIKVDSDTGIPFIAMFPTKEEIENGSK